MTQHYSTAPHLLSHDDCVLIIIDLQEKLMPVIAERAKVTDNVVRLLKFSRIINLPVVLTEQEKLGATIAEIKREIPDSNPVTKITFDSFLCEEFADRLHQLKKKTLLLTEVYINS